MTTPPAAAEVVRARFQFTLALPAVLRLRDGLYRGRLGTSTYGIALVTVQGSLGQPPPEGATATFKITTGELADVSKRTHVPGMLLEYSLVSIRFAGRVSAIPVPHEEALDARRMAHRFLNHFLDLYRFTAKDSATLPLTWGEFHEVRAGRALLCAMAPDDPEALSRAAGGEPIMQASFGVAFRDEDPIVHHFGPRRLIEEDVEAGLRKNLLEGVKPDLPALLLLNAAHHRAASDFRLAVIDASAALDIVVETLARRILVKRGLTLEAAEGKLERLTTLPTVREVIVGSTDMDVESDADWQAWETQHRHLRNKVVHDGHQPGESEAVDMLGSIDRLIGRFERASAV